MSKSFCITEKGIHKLTEVGVFPSTFDYIAFQLQFPCWNKCNIPKALQSNLEVLQPGLSSQPAFGVGRIPFQEQASPLLRLTAYLDRLLAPAWGCRWASARLSLRLQGRADWGSPLSREEIKAVAKTLLQSAAPEPREMYLLSTSASPAIVLWQRWLCHQGNSFINVGMVLQGLSTRSHLTGTLKGNALCFVSGYKQVEAAFLPHAVQLFSVTGPTCPQKARKILTTVRT